MLARTAMSLQEVAEQFVAAINAHDVEGIASLMTSDHRFIDSLGAVVEGRDAMREGWKFYFTMVPDYKLNIQRCFIAEDDKAEAVLVAVGEWFVLVEGDQATKLLMEHASSFAGCDSRRPDCRVASLRR